ncbi:MAG: hypothetical protein CL878_07300 [Dehalococcoidia bacterium]|nr:hypothetical protein [Dehalococcoidia bacterium]
MYVPCFNGAHWLRDCLQAIKSQTLPPDELLVIDDGSTDDSAEIAAEMGARVIWHETNRGLAAARNTALAHAEGDFIASVDADVVPDSEWLARLLDCLDTDRVGAAGGMLREHHATRAPDRWRARHMAQHWGAARTANPPCLCGGNTVYRADALRAAGCYDERYRTNYEDCDLYLRMRAAGYDAVYEPAAVASHQRSDSVPTVLATYTNWLRPPYAINGDYLTGQGLRRKMLATVDQLRAALAQDEAAGDVPLAYITILALLRTLIADLHVARDSTASADLPPLGATTPAAEAALRSALLASIAARHAHLPLLLDVHLSSVLAASPAVRDAGTEQLAATASLPEPLPEVLEAVTLTLDELSYPMWRNLPAAAHNVATEWLAGGAAAAVSQPRLPSAVRSAAAAVAASPALQVPAGITAWAHRRADDIAALVVSSSSDPIYSQAKVDLLAITHAPLPSAQAVRWREEVAQAGTLADGDAAPSLWHVPVHALGWLPPSAGLLDLRTSGRVIAGDPALLTLAPPVSPDELSRTEGLWRVAVAASMLIRLWPEPGASGSLPPGEAATCARAVILVSEAMLLARGAYRAQPLARQAALHTEHDGQPDLTAILASADVATAALRTGRTVEGYRQVARDVILDGARFCADWLMRWERPIETVAALCRHWVAWAGVTVEVPAAALALLAAAPPFPAELGALKEAAVLLGAGDRVQPSPPWAELRRTWASAHEAAEREGWPLHWRPPPTPGDSK